METEYNRHQASPSIPWTSIGHPSQDKWWVPNQLIQRPPSTDNTDPWSSMVHNCHWVSWTSEPVGNRSERFQIMWLCKCLAMSTKYVRNLPLFKASYREASQDTTQTTSNPSPGTLWRTHDKEPSKKPCRLKNRKESQPWNWPAWRTSYREPSSQDHHANKIWRTKSVLRWFSFIRSSPKYASRYWIRRLGRIVTPWSPFCTVVDDPAKRPKSHPDPQVRMRSCGLFALPNQYQTPRYFVRRKQHCLAVKAGFRKIK